MIDPLTALAAANAAFSTVKKLVEAGREVEDVAQQLGTWFEAASDINFAKEQAESPGVINSLFRSGSIEKQALDATIAREKLKEQEAELRSLITLRYSPQTYREMMQLRKDISARRDAAVYKRKQLIRGLTDGFAVVLFIAATGGLGWLVFLIVAEK